MSTISSLSSGNPRQRRQNLFSQGIFCVKDSAYMFCVSLLIIARLVRCLLGRTAISEKKLSHGNPLVILGIETRILRDGIFWRPDAEKVQKWCARIQAALTVDCLYGGESSKLAGGLQWAGQRNFKRLGRCMLTPLYK